jgi:hypothetical protein
LPFDINLVEIYDESYRFAKNLIERTAIESLISLSAIERRSSTEVSFKNPSLVVTKRPHIFGCSIVSFVSGVRKGRTFERGQENGATAWGTIVPKQDVFDPKKRLTGRAKLSISEQQAPGLSNLLNHCSITRS